MNERTIINAKYEKTKNEQWFQKPLKRQLNSGFTKDNKQASLLPIYPARVGCTKGASKYTRSI